MHDVRREPGGWRFAYQPSGTAKVQTRCALHTRWEPGGRVVDTVDVDEVDRTMVVVEPIVLVLDEAAGTEVNDGVLVEEAAPCSVESPHDTANSATIRPSSKPVLGNGRAKPLMTEP